MEIKPCCCHASVNNVTLPSKDFCPSPPPQTQVFYDCVLKCIKQKTKKSKWFFLLVVFPDFSKSLLRFISAGQLLNKIHLGETEVLFITELEA